MIERMRQRASHEVIVDWQQCLDVFVAPFVSPVTSALRAMAVAAGMVSIQPFITGIAIIDLAAQGICAAADNIFQRFFVAGQHALTVLCSVGRSVFPEDIGSFEHDWILATGYWLLVTC